MSVKEDILQQCEISRGHPLWQEHAYPLRTTLLSGKLIQDIQVACAGTTFHVLSLRIIGLWVEMEFAQSPHAALKGRHSNLPLCGLWSLSLRSLNFTEEMASKIFWLMVSTPLKNLKVSWDYYYSILFPIYGKSVKIPWFQSPPSSLRICGDTTSRTTDHLERLALGIMGHLSPTDPVSDVPRAARTRHAKHVTDGFHLRPKSFRLRAKTLLAASAKREALNIFKDL